MSEGEGWTNVISKLDKPTMFMLPMFKFLYNFFLNII